jgi:hypothetical protein
MWWYHGPQEFHKLLQLFCRVGNARGKLDKLGLRRLLLISGHSFYLGLELHNLELLVAEKVASSLGEDLYFIIGRPILEFFLSQINGIWEVRYIIWPGYSPDTFAFWGDSRLALTNLPVYFLRSFIIRPKLGAVSCISLGVHRTPWASQLVSSYAMVVEYPLIIVILILSHILFREWWGGLYSPILIKSPLGTV